MSKEPPGTLIEPVLPILPVLHVVVLFYNPFAMADMAVALALNDNNCIEKNNAVMNANLFAICKAIVCFFIYDRIIKFHKVEVV